jgi:glyceraldehyde 3-phosphate dehydrogenase
MTKIAINGFGRIGRPSLKIILEKPGMEIVAINDLGDINSLAYLLKYDTAYGVYNKTVEVEELPEEKYNFLIIDGQKIKVYANKEPEKLPWGELEVDVVLECTGFFKDTKSAGGHLRAGAKKVVISAPTKDEKIKTIVLGVNHNKITAEDEIFSNASCTTNCIAPIMKVLEDSFGVEKSLMSTIHSYTSTQNLVDGASRGDLRRGRAAAQNTIPASTGAAIATTKALPQLKGKFDGMAFRVPTVVGSISDVVAVVKRDVTIEEINEALTKMAQEELKGILEVTAEPLVTHDIIGNPHSSIVQTELTKVIGGNLVKVVGWYDNEWGYSNRLVELAEFVGKI